MKHVKKDNLLKGKKLSPTNKFNKQGLTAEELKQVKGGSFIIIEEVDGA